jgi:hypothetical protein
MLACNKSKRYTFFPFALPNITNLSLAKKKFLSEEKLYLQVLSAKSFPITNSQNKQKKLMSPFKHITVSQGHIHLNRHQQERERKKLHTPQHPLQHAPGKGTRQTKAKRHPFVMAEHS